MKRLIVIPLVTLILAMMLLVAPASAHVHGITPLNDCGIANANAGGNGTNGTPADDANGGPISGLIPSPLSGGDGGKGVTDCTPPD